MNKLIILYKWTGFPSLCLVLILTVVGVVKTPQFLSESFFTGFFGSFVPFILVAIGQAIVLLGKGIDISMGANLSLINVSIIHFLALGWDLIPASLIGIGIGMCIGVINGVVISFLRVSPLLVTLATSSVAGGLALWIQPYPGGSAPASFVNWYQQAYLGIPAPLFFVIFSLLLWTFIRVTPLGIKLYAVGGDPKKAYTTGINIARIRFFTYIFSALMAGMGAIAITGSMGSGDPLVGNSIILNSLAACVIGGISLKGGDGSVLGTVFGALFLGLVFTTVLSMQVSPFYQTLLSGLIVLISIMGAASIKHRKRKSV